MANPFYSEKQNKVFDVIKNGGLVFNLTQGIPLILWTVFIYQLYGARTDSKRSKCFRLFHTGNILLKLVYYLVFSLPFLIYFHNMYAAYHAPNPLHKVDRLTAISFPPGWQYCFSTKLDAEELHLNREQQGVVGTEDLECLKTNYGLLKNDIRDLIRRFYYMNYILLLLVIAFRYHTRFISVSFERNGCEILGYSILFGIIGTIAVIFEGYEIRGLWMVQLLSVLLAMNISCFILYLMTGLVQINK